MLSYLRDDACEIIISIWISHTAAHQGMDVNDAWRMLSIRTYGGGVSGARTCTLILILALFFTRSKITLINYFAHRLQSAHILYVLDCLHVHKITRASNGFIDKIQFTQGS